jgi:hypothetical protein
MVTPSVSFYLSLDSVKFHYPETNKKNRREYLVALLVLVTLIFGRYCKPAKIGPSFLRGQIIADED